MDAAILGMIAFVVLGIVVLEAGKRTFCLVRGRGDIFSRNHFHVDGHRR